MQLAFASAPILESFILCLSLRKYIGELKVLEFPEMSNISVSLSGMGVVEGWDKIFSNESYIVRVLMKRGSG